MELIKKLRIDADKVLWLINAPDDCKELFADLETKEKLTGKKSADQVVLFATDSGELNHYLPKLADHIVHDTLFWICYPKKTGAIQSDLIQMRPWDVVFNSGYRGQTSVSINDDWTGLRLTNAPKKNASICDLPMEERKVEGIDFINRTVELPADAQAAVSAYAGMADYFHSQSFTCKKEHIMAIADAKKPETRQRRIEKMVDMLQQQMHTKKKKKS